MNCFIFANPIVGAADDESSFWAQILVFVVLAVCWWVYSLVRSKRGEIEKNKRLAEEAGRVYVKPERQYDWLISYMSICKDSAQKYIDKVRARVITADQLAEPSLDSNLRVAAEPVKSAKDLSSGMELLGLDFLLGVVENTKGKEQTDVTLRTLNFNELMRRNELNSLSSKALKVYAVNKGNVYGKEIQCEALQELAGRTADTNRG